MSVLEHDFESEGHEGKLLSDHLAWLISRSILILVLVLIAFVTRLPFHRLLLNEVVLELETKERDRLTEYYNELSTLREFSVRFRNAYTHSNGLTLEAEAMPQTDNIQGAEVALLRAQHSLDALEHRFLDRNVQFDEETDETFEDLLRDGRAGLKAQDELCSKLREAAARKEFRTLQANQDLVDGDVAGIDQLEREYVFHTRDYEQ
jgi:hypothetical protein